MKTRWLFIFFLFVSQAVWAAFPQPSSPDSSYRNFQAKALPGNLIDLPGNASPVQKKFSFTQKQNFKLFRRQVRRQANEHKTGWLTVVGGLLLGIGLPLIGVGIAYLVTKNKEFRKWTLIGTGIYLAFVFIIYFLVIFGAIPI